MLFPDFVCPRWKLHTQSNIIPYILGFDAGFSSWTREEGKAMAMAEPSSCREHLSSFRRSVRHYDEISTIHTSFNNCRQRNYKDKRCEDRRLVVTTSFAFCVISFEPIEIKTRSAAQNDRLNLSFVKDIYVDSKKLARNGRQTTIYISWVSQVRKNIFAFCFITFELIEVQTHSAPQNECLNLRFVKGI